MKVKLVELAKELEVGVSTLNDLLIAKKVIETPYNPNARIDKNEYWMIIGEYGSGLSAKRKEEIENKLFPSSKPNQAKVQQPQAPSNTNTNDNASKESVQPKTANKPGVEVKGFIDLGKLSLGGTKKKAPQAVSTDPEKSNSLHPKEQQSLNEKVTSVKIDEPQNTEQVKKVEQSDANVQPNNKGIVQKQTPTVENTSTDTPKTEIKKQNEVENPKPKVVAQTDASTSLEVKSPQNDSKQSQNQVIPTQKKVEKVNKFTATPNTKTVTQKHTPKQDEMHKPEPAKEKNEAHKKVTSNERVSNSQSTDVAKATQQPHTPEIYRIEIKDSPKFNVKGKIDLSSIEPTRSEKKNERGGRSKRKRISAGAVDIKAEVAKGLSNNSQAKGSSKNERKGGNTPNNNKSQQNTNEQSQTQEKGRKARRNAQKAKVAAKKQEVSSDDIERQVREVRARIAAGKRQSFGKNDGRRKRDLARRQAEMDANGEQEEKVIKITEFVTVSDLANLMGVPVNEVIATCMSIDMMVSINMRLDSDTITLIAEEFGFKTEFVSADVVEAIQETEEHDSEDELVERPPVVTVMGHVDHGKTSLLDHIRNTNVIAGEAGGITQHIGAYSVTLKNGRRVTFLDTPGHQAFTAMRARGAKATDIAIIIIDATSDVMPQTKEALNHASATGVPIVFAINKVDKPTANPNHIKEQLAQLNYLVEDWGGKYQCQEISAKKGDGVRELIDKVLLEADILELRANPNKPATGLIIESSLDKGRGYVAQILVSNGTLRIGDMVLAGKYCGRVKALTNERGQNMEFADPSTPATLLGLDGAPSAGDTFNVMVNEQDARNIARRRRQLDREQDIRTQHRLTLEQIGQRIKIGNFKELNLIIKGDVNGSIEALGDSLIKLSTEEIDVKVIHKAVGQISENDVDLAKASDAIIIGFQVRPNGTARRLAEQYGVEIRTYSIIYDAIDDVKSAMEGMLSPEIREQETATLEVLQVFNIKGTGTIAGCMVKEGKIKRSDKARVIRDGIVIHTGALSSLKRYKDDAKEVATGLECGLSITNYDDIQVGDIIESFMEMEVKKTL